MTREIKRTSGESISGFAGVSGGTGLVYFGKQLGGGWGTTLVYLSPFICWALAYGLFRWNDWADQRARQRALHGLEEEIGKLLAGDDLSAAEKGELKRALAELKLHAGRQGIERVRVLLDAPSPAAGGPPGLDFEAWRATVRPSSHAGTASRPEPIAPEKEGHN